MRRIHTDYRRFYESISAATEALRRLRDVLAWIEIERTAEIARWEDDGGRAG